MGRDLTLYPQKASRADLKDYLEGLGFAKCKHFWDWPAGTLNYAWYDERDFRSIDGVSADIYPVVDEEVAVTGNPWALHVRNLYSASWHDVKMLNDVLREARKKFGGIIKGDYGTNRYVPLWIDESTPISRGVSAIYQRVDRELRAIKHDLPASRQSSPTVGASDKKMHELVEFTKSIDPVRVIYNGLVPFAVAMFEYFFSHAFKVLIAYDPIALEKRSKHKLRVDFATLLQVDDGSRTVEDVIAREYTFQNLDQLNKAYKEWLDMDVRALMYRRKRIGKKVTFLESRIKDIIEYRHGVVHHFALDRSLTKAGYIAILDAVEASILEFVALVERRYNVEIERV